MGPQAQVVQLPPQLGAAGGGQTIQLLVTGRIGGRGPIDPAVFEQPPERSVHRPGAQTDAAVAQRFDVLHEPVPVAGLRGETQEDPEGRLTERLDPFGIASCDDVSHDDILRKPHNRVNERREQSLRTVERGRRQSRATAETARAQRDAREEEEPAIAIAQISGSV
jgi:hypothetical protein